MRENIFEFPGLERVIYGKPAAPALAGEVERLGLRRVFLVVSGTMNRTTDEVEKVRAALGDRYAATYDGIPPFNPRSAVLKAAELARSVGTDLVVTFGGGSVTEAGKVVRLCLQHDITDADGFDRFRAVTKPDGTRFMMQNPLDNPDATIRKHSRLNRILVYDPRTGASLQYGYLLDSTSAVVSDIAAISNTAYLVLERDQLFSGDPKSPSKLKRVYRIDISQATDLSDPNDARNGKRVNEKTLEQLTDAELAAAGVVTVSKKLIVDLLAMRKKVYEEQGLLLKQESGPAARNQVQHSIIRGSPATVAEEIAKIDKIGIGGLLMVFRMGPMPSDVAENSMRLFMKKVAPEFGRGRQAFAVA